MKIKKLTGIAFSLCLMNLSLIYSVNSFAATQYLSNSSEYSGSVMLGTSGADDLETRMKNDLIGQCTSSHGTPDGDVSCTRNSWTYGNSNNMYNWTLHVSIDCQLRCQTN
jgi:hypothetical protein